MERCLLIGVIALAILILAASSNGALAQSGGGYALTRNTQASSTLLSAGGYTLRGTAGQPEASGLRGGAYTLAGGFWGGSFTAPPVYRIYLPLLLQGRF